MKNSLPTWWKYLFFRFGLLTFALALIAFGLFIFVDIITHIKDICDPETSWAVWQSYYLCLIITRAGIVVPFAIATATSLLIPQLVRSNGLIPLQNAGLSLQQIVRPFFVVTLLASGLLLVNSQFFLPRALRHQSKISDSDFGRKPIREEPARLGVVLFPEGSRLFFFQHDKAKQQIEDSFWVRSHNCIVHIEHLLYFKDRAPEGRGIDILERDKNGRMQKTASYPFLELSQLHFTKESVKMAMSDPRHLSLTQLCRLVTSYGSATSERSTETKVAFYGALFFPVLAWLAFLFPAPMCFRFEKRFPQALVVFLSLSVLFGFLLVVHAAQILARIPFIPTSCILIFPWIVSLFIGLRRLQRMV